MLRFFSLNNKNLIVYFNIINYDHHLNMMKTLKRKKPNLRNPEKPELSN